jgi:hypothetical protein
MARGGGAVPNARGRGARHGLAYLLVEASSPAQSIWRPERPVSKPPRDAGVPAHPRGREEFVSDGACADRPFVLPADATSTAALSLLHRRHEPPERTPSTIRSPHAWGAEGTATMCVTFALDHGGNGERRLGRRSSDMGARWSLPLASACILASLYSSVDPKGRASAVRGRRRRQVQSQQ